MWKAMLGALISPVTDLVKNRQEIKREKNEAKATVKRILTEAAAEEPKIAAQIALANIASNTNSFKDEYALMVISGPFLIGMTLGALEGAGLIPIGTTGAVMNGMFAEMENIPTWWSSTFQAGMLSALGVTLWNKARNV